MTNLTKKKTSFSLAEILLTILLCSLLPEAAARRCPVKHFFFDNFYKTHRRTPAIVPSFTAVADQGRAVFYCSF